MSWSELQPGVYEALLTKLLVKQLPSDERLYRLARIPPADGPALLARYIADLIEMVLRGPSFEGNAERQVEYCNRLIELVAKDSRVGVALDDLIDEKGRQLLEVHRPPKTPLAAIEPLPRPTIPLSQNALLVSSNQEPSLARELKHELASADRVDLLCAFIKWSGIRVLVERIKSARIRGVPLRIITTTYTGVTEARALDELASLGADIRVSYETQSTRLHAKAWLFERNSGFSTAYVGSSNLSHSALHDGLEWNVRLTQPASAPLLQRFRAAFDTYWADPSFESYDRDKFDKALKRALPSGDTAIASFDIQPYPFQREMLYQLEVERLRHGRWRNLIVAATGTGKTVVSAFDYKRVRETWGEASLLFVAHRQEILRQSLDTFRNVLRDGSFGELMVAGERPSEGRHVFASVQSLHALGRTRLGELSPDAYDVVIVDEFHHAAAPTYQNLLEHLRPKLLLGMTATPERSDGLDIKQWFDGHTAVELRLWDALEQGLLCPFQYFGVADGVDLSQLTWSRGGYDLGQLEKFYTGNDGRVAKVLKTMSDVVEDPRAMRALGFCVSVKHAEYMAESFRREGIPAIAVSANSTQSERADALRKLRDRTINVIFAVDLFNEGLDIPDIDTLFFLRPTESPVVFLQQLGRGLRRTEGKAGVTVLDFIGQQHRRFRFEERFKAILGCDHGHVLRQIEDDFPFLPAGCSISLDRQSQKAIVDNIKGALRLRGSYLSERLEEFGDVTMSDFLANGAFSLEDIYSGSNPGWTRIRRQAGFITETGPDEPILSKALGRMLHIDDPDRVRTYTQWLAQTTPPDVSGLPIRELRLANMLHFDLWSSSPGSTPLQASLDRLWANPNIVSELRELLEVLDARASRLAPPSGLEPEMPLRLHTRYSRDELLAALGETMAARPTTWREGVRWIDRYKMDIFVVTLNKSERRFSPTTRYRDYPISPTLFHWESQSTTRASSTTGQRYVQHQAKGSRVLLFVRESSEGESLGASPFLFLGQASYVSHQGERPMAIVWRLDHEMPLDFFQAARVAV
jgi:superfamily II DNA or RNA helicase